MDKVLSSRFYYKRLQYQVQWTGWDPDPKWYDAVNFKNAALKLKQYHDENPDAAGPPQRLKQWLDAAAKDEFDDDHPDDNLPTAPGDGRHGFRRGKR